MSKIIDAIYESGAFRLTGEQVLPYTDGTHVRLSVEPAPSGGSQDVLELAADVYTGLSETDIRAIEQIATDRSRFFSE